MEKRHGVKKPEAWLEIALRENFAGQNSNIEENRKFAEQFKADKRWVDLKMAVAYCTHGPSDRDYQFKLPPESFREMLINCYNQQY